MPEPLRTERLRFAAAGEASPQRDLSAVVVHGDTMFVACDEGAVIERLTRGPGGTWDSHRRVRLGELVDLPGGAEGEMDIEGLAIDEAEDGPWLWVLGSQSLKRRKAQGGPEGPEGLATLGRVEWEPNRQFLGRFPLRGEGGTLLPVEKDAGRRVQHVRLTAKGKLRRWMRRDRHLARALRIPSKENGLDVEGIAARGLRVWVGLRGPLLRRNAVILEMEMRVTRKGHLKPRRIDGRRRYRKHALDTRGLGIRDLHLAGEDLLAVVGTVTSSDGPAAILRLPRLGGRGESGWLSDQSVEGVIELPYRGPHDHPEGLAHLGGGDWIVLYDSPHPDRVRDDPPEVEGDVWRLGLSPGGVRPTTGDGSPPPPPRRAG